MSPASLPLPLLAPVLHAHTSVEEWLSTALWAGLVILLTVLVVAGLLASSRLLTRRAAERRRPCAECGYFYEQSGKGVCPQCGRAPDPSPDVREPR